MKVPSLKRIPSAPVALTLSEPARSTRFLGGGIQRGVNPGTCVYVYISSYNFNSKLLLQAPLATVPPAACLTVRGNSMRFSQLLP